MRVTVPRSDTDKYGIVSTEPPEGRVSRVKQIIEKPRPQNAPSTLAAVLEHRPDLAVLDIRMPPDHADDGAVADLFEQVRRELALPQFDTLSMGMTADLEAAIAAGSTLVRVGTAIFGKR